MPVLAASTTVGAPLPALANAASTLDDDHNVFAVIARIVVAARFVWAGTLDSGRGCVRLGTPAAR
jgi:hypothetical protein